MLALRKVKTGQEQLELHTISEPTLRPHHVIIDVAAAGICGTDLHIMKDEYRARPPVTLGHEVAGVISAVGEGVDGFSVGQRVVTETYFSVCGHCQYCRTGYPNLCAERQSIGSMVAGGFAPKLLVPVTNLHPSPDNLAFPEAALVEPLACVVRGLLERNHIQAGDKAVITGPGAIGLLALLVAKAAGAKVLVIGTHADEARLELAKQLGADSILTAGSADPDVVNSILGAPPDVAIECSGAAPAASLLLSLVKKAGRYVQVGLYGKPINLDFDQVCYKELQVSGSFATTPSSWYRALSLIENGVIDLSVIVGRTYPLTQWQDAFAAVIDRTPGKVLLVP